MAKFTLTIEDQPDGKNFSFGWEQEDVPEDGTTTASMIVTKDISQFFNNYLIHHGATTNIGEFKEAVIAEYLATKPKKVVDVDQTPVAETGTDG